MERVDGKAAGEPYHTRRAVRAVTGPLTGRRNSQVPIQSYLDPHRCDGILCSFASPSITPFSLVAWVPHDDIKDRPGHLRRQLKSVIRATFPAAS
jgi:hypothetical protein